MLNGSCLCGDVHVTVTGAPVDPTACHCSQCRKMSGHVWASVNVSEDEIEIVGPVRWYTASENARRGFCPRCGSSLFWQANDSGRIALALGAVDGATGLQLSGHIFVADKGDYYTIAEAEPQLASED